MDDLTPGQRRTLKARETRTKNKLDRMAAELRDAGYGVVPPEVMTNEDLDLTHLTVELARG